MKVSRENCPVKPLIGKMKREKIVLKHKLQRRESVWSNPNKSLLIDSLLALHVESSHAGVDGAVAQLLLDAQQLVVLCHTLRSAGRSGFDLAGIQRNSQIRDCGILRFAGAVG